MYIARAAEVSFFASGEEYRLLVANLLCFMRAYAKVWNAAETETSVVLDRVISIERNSNAIRHKICFNMRRESANRLEEILVDFVESFLWEAFPEARHITYSYRIFK